MSEAKRPHLKMQDKITENWKKGKKKVLFEGLVRRVVRQCVVNQELLKIAENLT
jgi:hypothetical protein